MFFNMKPDMPHPRRDDQTHRVDTSHDHQGFADYSARQGGHVRFYNLPVRADGDSGRTREVRWWTKYEVTVTSKKRDRHSFVKHLD